MNGFKHGKGIEYSKYGNIHYEGDFINEKYEGIGKLYYGYGKLEYEGSFMNGLNMEKEKNIMINVAKI